jgi:methylenetetrahydrofolate--tRNA-(uracil-5-)-methyltransferase
MSNNNNHDIIVIGGGLAGSEAAWQVAQRGKRVLLFEMRPQKMTPAHVSGKMAELVCSNSLGSVLIDRAPGLLKEEMRRLGSLIIEVAQMEGVRVPAGGALAVGREVFATEVTRRLEGHPKIEIRREEVKEVPEGIATIIASGPLTSDALAASIQKLTGEAYLYFYDALSPIVEMDSIDMSKAYRASRYGRGEQAEGDYINCPMNKEEYDAFVAALLAAERAPIKEFEQLDKPDKFFEGCLPVEIIAQRGHDSLAFGPMRPVGLRNPHTGERPHAVVQLRQDNVAGTIYNLVGFQTSLKWGEQKRVFSMIPGLENADWVRMGQMHRNTFINSPTQLHPTMQFRSRHDLFFAGQIVGVEGYAGNAATGILAGLNAVRLLEGKPLITLAPTTMLGALCHYITHAAPKHFQPMKSNFGILPPFQKRIRNKRQRYAAYSERALRDLQPALEEIGEK